MNRQQLQQIISDAFEVSWNEIISKKRNVNLVFARNIYCFHRYYGNAISTEVVGSDINRDHATVLHGLSSYRRDYQNCEAFKRIADEVEERIKTTTSCHLKRSNATD